MLQEIKHIVVDKIKYIVNIKQSVHPVTKENIAIVYIPQINLKFNIESDELKNTLDDLEDTIRFFIGSKKSKVILSQEKLTIRLPKEDKKLIETKSKEYGFKNVSEYIRFYAT